MQKLLFLAAVAFMSGCMAVRTYTVDKPRIDTDVQGNRGYLSGTPDQEPAESKFGETRKVSVVEIEFGRSKSSKKSTPSVKETPLYELGEEEDIESISLDQEDVMTDDESMAEPKNYVVQKNDTLQKISQKFYGTTRKWMKIYEYNKDVLKSPDKVYPGMKLKIPNLN